MARKYKRDRGSDKGAGAKAAKVIRPMKTDIHTQERVLRFVNAARVPEDLTVLPHDVQVVDEAAGHMGDIPHHVEHKHTFDLKTAWRILKARLEANLLHGFVNIRDLIAIDRRFFDHVLTALGPATYGRWDYLYEMEAGGVALSIEHAAVQFLAVSQTYDRGPRFGSEKGRSVNWEGLQSGLSSFNLDYPLRTILMSRGVLTIVARTADRSGPRSVS